MLSLISDHMFVQCLLIVGLTILTGMWLSFRYIAKYKKMHDESEGRAFQRKMFAEGKLIDAKKLPSVED